jgi:type 1 fimbriae regulatory protein FimB
MAEPGINEIEAQIDPIRDRIPILSHVDKAAAIDAKQAKRGSKPLAWLSMSEIKSLMAVIVAPRDRAIWSVAYHRGLRASEVGLLQMRDYTPPTINERTGKLYVRRLKDSDSKIYQLTKPENKELRAWLRVRGDYDGPIFPSSRRRPISRKRLDALMKWYGELAALPPELRHFHALKHSCGVHLLLQGLGVDQVKDWLGHRNIQNTMIYLRVANIRLDAAAEKLVNW